jgi:repressor LexA
MNLKYFRMMNGLSQQRLANKLGVSRSTVAMWETGKSQPDNSLLLKSAQILNVSVDELLGNESAPQKSDNAIKVPVLGYVAAGIPIEQIEDILDYEELDPERFNPNCEYFALKIRGDSMQPRIMDGDVVIVRKQPSVESGEIAIVCVNGEEATCKQVRKHEDGLSLISLNQSYAPMYFTPKEVAEKPVTILGKVIELRGKF